MNSNNRIAATLYSLGTQFVSGIKVPCIKEMMMMMIIIFIVTYYNGGYQKLWPVDLSGTAM